MRTVPEIIEAFGGPKKFGVICGFVANPSARGSDMKHRGSIPVRYWPAVTAAKPEKGKRVTNDELIRAHSVSRRPALLRSQAEAQA